MVRRANQILACTGCHTPDSCTANAVCEHTTRASARQHKGARPQGFYRARPFGCRNLRSCHKAPNTGVLWPAQTLGLLGREAPDRRAVGQRDHQVLLVVLRDRARGRRGKDASRSLEAGVDDVRARRRNHCAGQEAGVFHSLLVDPVRAGERLAEAAPREQAPLGPVCLGRQLLVTCRSEPLGAVEHVLEVILTQERQALGVEPHQVHGATHRADCEQPGT